MSKPKVFLSSTCFDLKDVRAALFAHIEAAGLEPLASDTVSFTA